LVIAAEAIAIIWGNFREKRHETTCRDRSKYHPIG
jgi:hypothetical protein